MSRRRLHPPLRRRLAWLLWLALMLPLMQAGLLWHGLSHATPRADARDPGPQAPNDPVCDVCLAAQAVTGGAPLSAPAGLPEPTASFAVPPGVCGAGWWAPVALAYSSRAPPLRRV